jgi:hypothetical protein
VLKISLWPSSPTRARSTIKGLDPRLIDAPEMRHKAHEPEQKSDMLTRRLCEGIGAGVHVGLGQRPSELYTRNRPGPNLAHTRSTGWWFKRPCPETAADQSVLHKEINDDSTQSW